MVMSYKGFGKNLQCRGFQFEVGQTYTHAGAVKVCERGFHACEYPLDVFNYYAPGDSRFCTVEQDGDIQRHDDDSKIVSSVLTVKTEIGIPGLVKAAVEYIVSRCAPPDPESPATNTGTRSAATNTGDQSAATNTGAQSAACVEGKHSVAVACGHVGRAKAAAGSAIVLVNRGDDGSIRHIRAAVAGREIKPDVWYTLGDDGEFQEVETYG